MRNLKFIAFGAICVLIGVLFFTVGCKKTSDASGEPKSDNLLGSKAFCDPGTVQMSTVNSTARIVELNTTIYNTDFISAGISGTRNVGAGTIVLSGVSGTVSKAYLYWHGITNSTTDVGNPIMVNGTPVAGTHLGYSDDNCWDHHN